MSDVTLSLDAVHTLAMEAFRANGCDEANARAIADNITLAERNGASSHGLFRVPGYVGSLRNGKINGHALPKAQQTAPSLITVDGDRGPAPHALEMGRAPLIALTRELGMAALAIRRAHHYAALWPETEALAREGLVAMAFVNSPPYMAAAGGRSPFFGTNPMSFAWPRPNGEAMVWDQASSAMARGEVQIALREGHEVPDGSGIDSDGNPTNDPAAILEGAQLPFGGYKGSAIALMVDLLAGPLLDEVSSQEAGAEDNGDGGPATGGELILAIDPIRFGGPNALVRAEQLFTAMTNQPDVRLPGDRRKASRQATPETGIRIPQSLFDTIKDLTG